MRLGVCLVSRARGDVFVSYILNQQCGQCLFITHKVRRLNEEIEVCASTLILTLLELNK